MGFPLGTFWNRDVLGADTRLLLKLPVVFHGGWLRYSLPADGTIFVLMLRWWDALKGSCDQWGCLPRSSQHRGQTFVCPRLLEGT